MGSSKITPYDELFLIEDIKSPSTIIRGEVVINCDSEVILVYSARVDKYILLVNASLNTDDIEKAAARYNYMRDQFCKMVECRSTIQPIVQQDQPTTQPIVQQDQPYQTTNTKVQAFLATLNQDNAKDGQRGAANFLLGD